MRICIMGGCGHFHTALKPDIELAGVCLTGEETPGFSFLINRFGKVPVFPSYEEMLKECMPDLVVIDGLFGHHADMAVCALERGIHVYCEKPMAINEEQYKRLKNAYKASNAQIAAMLTSRYEPCFYTLYKRVRERTIGNIKLINAQKSYIFGERPQFYAHPEQYGNTFMWVGIHSVDLILWLTNSSIVDSHYFPSGKNSFGFEGLDESAVAILKLQNGVLATVTVDFLRDEDADTHGDDRIRVVGDKGILEVKDERLYLFKDGEEQELELSDAPDIFLDFIENLDDKGKRLADDEAAFLSTEAVVNITGV
ncbi:MAG: Inositol 2-dehydrogenase [Firmicutes bacterium ADurb.Bin300]|nr:MAG: Inositol 2-dehydrogenase [Firmicutes bacterium ADurb.Bin300]